MIYLEIMRLCAKARQSLSRWLGRFHQCDRTNTPFHVKQGIQESEAHLWYYRYEYEAFGDRMWKRPANGKLIGVIPLNMPGIIIIGRFRANEFCDLDEGIFQVNRAFGFWRPANQAETIKFEKQEREREDRQKRRESMEEVIP